MWDTLLFDMLKDEQVSARPTEYRDVFLLPRPDRPDLVLEEAIDELRLSGLAASSLDGAADCPPPLDEAR